MNEDPTSMARRLIREYALEKGESVPANFEDIDHGGETHKSIHDAVVPNTTISAFWRQDDWFTKYHLSSVTPEFEAWWVGHYGKPEDFVRSEIEQQEYFVRASFALAGWNASLRKPEFPLKSV